MSWARLGATATGVDISDTAIDLARKLDRELGLGVRFIRANVYDLPDLLDERFDIVYTGVGAICWLPDLDAWADIVARFLKAGGTFYMLDVHPMSLVFDVVQDPDGKPDLRPVYSYFPDPAGLLDDGERPTYAGSTPIKTPVYEWQHSLSEVVNALLRAGLTDRVPERVSRRAVPSLPAHERKRRMVAPPGAPRQHCFPVLDQGDEG